MRLLRWTCLLRCCGYMPSMLPRGLQAGMGTEQEQLHGMDAGHPQSRCGAISCGRAERIMSHLIGLLMVWLGGALCGATYAMLWLGRRARISRRADGYYTKADVDAAWRRIRRYNFAPPASAMSAGQEQRMVTDAMIEAGREAYSDWQQSLDPRTCSLGEAIYTAMYAARPTVDLGEDGENKRLPSESTMDAAARILGAPDHRAFLAIATKSNKCTLNAVCQMLGILERLLGVLDRPHIIILDGEQHLHKGRVFGEARAAIGKGQG